ncbi:MAG: hypothetical protein K2X91_17345 [Thermoleophilia bacterium]|nr:hypothetical protein [Thermoleophilia bacterium]
MESTNALPPPGRTRRTWEYWIPETESAPGVHVKVTEVVPADKLMARARELAEMILTNAPLAVWGTKMGILQGLGLPIPQAEEIAAGYLEIVEQSEDHTEGPRAFVEKRKPVWKAR